jgi:hypothetical protein
MCIRVGVFSGDVVFLCCTRCRSIPIPPLNTDCPEVIGLVNHSATVLVMLKVPILNHEFSELLESSEGWQNSWLAMFYVSRSSSALISGQVWV